MAILTRITRLFRADAHAVLDALEEPEAQLKQAIREMQEALDVKRAALVRNQKALASLKSHSAAQTEELSLLERNLGLALKEGTEELARKTIGRKLSLAKRLSVLQRRIDALEAACREQSEETAQQEAQLEAVVEKARALGPVVREDSAFSVAESILGASEGRAGPGRGIDVSDEEIELEWIRLQRADQPGGAK